MSKPQIDYFFNNKVITVEDMHRGVNRVMEIQGFNILFYWIFLKCYNYIKKVYTKMVWNGTRESK